MSDSAPHEDDIAFMNHKKAMKAEADQLLADDAVETLTDEVDGSEDLSAG